MQPSFFTLGDVDLEHGGRLRDAELGYVTAGRLAPGRDNAVLVPSAFGGTHEEMAWLVGPGRAIDTDDFFVVMPSLFGTGLSTSPTRAHPDQAGGSFPLVSIVDNVRAQRRLVAEELEIDALHGVVGCSMGAIQALHWAVMAPDAVRRVVAVCGAASTTTHCRVFLDGCAGAIELDPVWSGGHYVQPPEAGLRHLGRVWAAWGFSPAFYAQDEHLKLGFGSLEEYLVGVWEAAFTAYDANNVMSSIRTWADADVARVTGTDSADALARITAATLVMPAETDRYFCAEDICREAADIPGATVRTIPGPYGHFSCGGGFAEPAEMITQATREFLEVS